MLGQTLQHPIKETLKANKSFLRNARRLTTDSECSTGIDEAMDDADPSYLHLYHNKMQGNRHQYIE